MARRISYSNHLQLALIHTISTLCVLQAQEGVVPEEGLEMKPFVGGRSIVIPPPSGYVRADGLNDQWDQVATAYVPSENRLIATFISESDRNVLANNGQPNVDRYFHLQVIRAFETIEFDETQFSRKKKEIKEEILAADHSTVLNDQLSEGNANIAGKTGKALATSEGEHRFLRIFDDSDQSLGFSITGTINEKTEAIVTSARIVPVSKRLLVFYAVSVQRDDQDQAWTENAVTDWSNTSMLANPTAFEAPPKPRIPPLSSRRMTAIAGLVIGLIAWLVIAKKRRAKPLPEAPKR